MIVRQTITIHHLRVDAVTNSSVLQIGTAGLVRSASHLYNTGGFTAPAPPLEADAAVSFLPPLVPFASVSS